MTLTVEEALKEAVTHHRDGRHAEAESLYRRILAVDPDNAGAHHNLGRIAITFGMIEAALPHLEAAVKARSDVVLFLVSLGEVLSRLGRRKEASPWIERAKTLQPGLAHQLFNQALALHHAGSIAEATEGYRQALAVEENMPDVWNNLGTALTSLGRLDDGIAAYRRSLEIKPDYVDAHYNLAVTLADHGQPRDALVHYRKAVELKPDYVEAHNNMGGVLSDLGRAKDAEAAHRRALDLRPDFAGALYNLGVALNEQARFDEALESFRRSLEINPGIVEAHGTIAHILKIEGRYDEAIDQYNQALAKDPGNVLAHRNLLSTILYHPRWSPERLFAEHRRFETMHARPHYPQAVSFANSPDPDRRIRIGYLSSDLKGHPVGRNLLPLVEAHDKAGFELFFYAHVANSDAASARFRAQAAGWRQIIGQSDDAVAEIIRTDGIDILVSLAGRFDLNRPQVCARRPAPIQVSFHDPATSGMEVMDYLIADHVLVPRSTAERFTERPIRLPSFYLHDPIDNAPEIVRPPMLDRGYPTFGSFNNPIKLSDDTLELWARVLQAVPNARLRLKYREWFQTPALARRITSIMDGHGIAPGRIDLLGSGDDTAAHLALYRDIDIALDPFPFNGSTTTFEALWMGVPVVTLPGQTMVSRWAASILSPLGLNELIAASPSEYVEICRSLCAAPDQLADLRTRLRPRLAASPLCSGAIRTRQIERVYRALWRRWCAHQTKVTS